MILYTVNDMEWGYFSHFPLSPVLPDSYGSQELTFSEIRLVSWLSQNYVVFNVRFSLIKAWSLEDYSCNLCSVFMSWGVINTADTIIVSIYLATTILSTLHFFFHLFFTITLSKIDKYCYILNLTNEEMESLHLNS